jgi:hypothetical protein
MGDAAQPPDPVRRGDAIWEWTAEDPRGETNAMPVCEHEVGATQRVGERRRDPGSIDDSGIHAHNPAWLELRRPLADVRQKLFRLRHVDRDAEQGPRSRGRLRKLPAAVLIRARRVGDHEGRMVRRLLQAQVQQGCVIQ